jgi:hypothetical protein
MPSTYTGLGTQLMATGENAGTWGTKTNTNLNILEQIAGGFDEVDIAGAAQTTTLAVSDGSTGAALANRVIEFTGAITGNQIVTIPLDVETFYIVKNTTTDGTDAYTVQFKYVSGSGSSVTFAGGDRGTKIIYAEADDATNPNIVDATSAFVTATSTTTLTNKTLTSPKINEDVVCSSTATELNLLDGCTSTTAELNYNDLTTLGTSAASKVLSADANSLTKITGAAYFEEATLTFDATQDWDVRTSPVAKVTLTANVDFDAPSNPTTGQFVSIVCIQDGTGSRTIAWNAVFEFAADTAPTATTTADKGDLFSFRYNGSKWLEVGRTLNLTLS